MKKQSIALITGNKHKLAIARRAFREQRLDARFTLKQVALDVPELQDVDTRTVSEFSARLAFQQLGTPLLKSDAGVYIDALRGFPGPFLRHMNHWLTADDLLRLMCGKKNRSAVFVDTLTYVNARGMATTFTAKLHGRIAEKVQGSFETMINTLFIPLGHTKTLAAMTRKELLGFWVDTRWQQLAQHLRKQSTVGQPKRT